MSFIDNAYIGIKFRTNRFLRELCSDESGISPFVASILMIVIVVALCAVFWTNISEWFNTMWTKISGDSQTIGK